MAEFPDRDRLTPSYAIGLVRLAYSGIQAQRLRAILSVLGITVGIAAVIAILAVGEGAREDALREVESLGTNTILVRRAALADAAAQTGGGLSFGLRVGDMDRLRRILPDLSAIAPVVEEWGKVGTADREVQGRRVGTTSEAAVTSKLTLRVGRFLHRQDGELRRPVCVLGAQLSQELFRLESPIGRAVRVGDAWFQVVGVLASRSEQPAHGDQGLVRAHDINRDLYVPLETIAPAGELRDDWPVDELSIVVARDADVSQAARIVRAVLERTHKGVRDYEVVVPVELLEQRRQTQRIFNGILTSVAGLSLLVGGIGIMNIMLATVTERTPEVGLRRAVGATARDIALQFLVEAATLTSLGGLVGMVLGVACSWALHLLGGWSIRISPMTIAEVLGVSVLAGLLFGLYPARKAAAADPIAALRYE